jgi:transglutaminase-like putative cysteine protease
MVSTLVPEHTAYRLRTAPVALALLAVAAATVSAGLVVTRIYAGTQLPVLLAGATVGAVAFSVLLRALRAGSVLTVVGGLVGLACCLVGATAALRDPSQGTLLAALSDALRNSGARILTSAIPVQPGPDTVLLPIAATWLAGSIATVLLGPLRASDRTATPHRRAAYAAIPPLLLLIGGLVLVGPNGNPSYPALAGFVLALAALLVVSGQAWSVLAAAAPVSAESRRVLRAARARRAAAAVVVVAVLGAVAVVAGPGLASLVRRQPVDPRSYVVPPDQHIPALNPLGMLALWAIDPNEPMLSVRTDHPERIQWATLSGYNGITWQPDRTYRAAGSVLPAPTATGDKTLTVHQTITVQDLRGGWLPGVAHVRQVQGVRIGYDATAGAVLTPDGLSAGMTYQTVSAAPEPDPNVLATASVPTAATAKKYLKIPAGLDPRVVTLAQQTASGGTPYRKALLLEQFLRTKYKYWSKAPSGNGYPTLTNFLLVSAAKGGSRGTSEQFAAAFALLGRIVGLPTRLVVGFHAGTRTGHDRYEVSSGDAFAWPEVWFTGHGWVPFDPTPTASKGATPPDENTPQSKSQQQQKSRQLDNTAPSPNPTATASASPHPGATGTGTGPLNPASLGGLAAALLLVLAVAAILLARWRRTAHRLDSGPPPDRILGAWAEVRDALRLAGARPDPALSAAELATFAAAVPTKRRTPDLADLTPLATTVNAVRFAPHPTATEPSATTATTAARHYTHTLRARLTFLHRLAWRLDPRPLFWKD